jgi:hypothetical protein
MRRHLATLTALTALGLIAGCETSSTQFTPTSEAENTAGVSVLYDYPAAPYKKVGLIDLDYYRPGWRAPTVTDAMPRLREGARNVGGNAFIIRGQRPGQVESRSIIVSNVVRAAWP